MIFLFKVLPLHRSLYIFQKFLHGKQVLTFFQFVGSAHTRPQKWITLVISPGTASKWRPANSWRNILLSCRWNGRHYFFSFTLYSNGSSYGKPSGKIETQWWSDDSIHRWLRISPSTISAGCTASTGCSSINHYFVSWNIELSRYEVYFRYEKF